MCCGEDILEADIGWISDDGIELLGDGVIEEVCVDMVDMACVAGVIKGRVDF